MSIWIVIIAAGIGSYLLRVGMVAAADRIRVPAWMDRVSALVAPAALAALAATSVASAATSAGAPGAIAPLAAVAVAVLAVIRTGSPYVAMLVGMPTLWVVTILIT